MFGTDTQIWRSGDLEILIVSDNACVTMTIDPCFFAQSLSQPEISILQVMKIFMVMRYFLCLERRQANALISSATCIWLHMWHVMQWCWYGAWWPICQCRSQVLTVSGNQETDNCHSVRPPVLLGLHRRVVFYQGLCSFPALVKDLLAVWHQCALSSFIYTLLLERCFVYLSSDCTPFLAVFYPQPTTLFSQKLYNQAVTDSHNMY